MSFADMKRYAKTTFLLFAILEPYRNGKQNLKFDLNVKNVVDLAEIRRPNISCRRVKRAKTETSSLDCCGAISESVNSSKSKVEDIDGSTGNLLENLVGQRFTCDDQPFLHKSFGYVHPYVHTIVRTRRERNNTVS